MIHAVFKGAKGKPTSFSFGGHSGRAEKGEDIVCAAVSSAALMAANTITDILSVEAEAEARDGMIRLAMKEDSKEGSDIIRGLLLHIGELQKKYPDSISITTEV